MIYVRWRGGENRRGRVFPPLSADHPSFDDPCPACGERAHDQPTQLVVVGPADEDNQARYDEGRWYNAAAVLLHEACADSLSDVELERLADR